MINDLGALNLCFSWAKHDKSIIATEGREEETNGMRHEVRGLGSIRNTTNVINLNVMRTCSRRVLVKHFQHLRVCECNVIHSGEGGHVGVVGSNPTLGRWHNLGQGRVTSVAKDRWHDRRRRWPRESVGPRRGLTEQAEGTVPERTRECGEPNPERV